jgi:Tol biopolymer transport system component
MRTALILFAISAACDVRADLIDQNLIDGGANDASATVDASTSNDGGPCTPGTIEGITVSSAVVSNGPSGQPDITPDGRYVVFTSSASNLVPKNDTWFEIYRYDRLTGTFAIVSTPESGAAFDNSLGPSVSDDGNFVSFYATDNTIAGDTNVYHDVYVSDVLNGTLIRASVGYLGDQPNQTSDSNQISGNGRRVVFESTASNLVPNDTNDHNDAFVRDLIDSTTILATVANDGSQSTDRTLSLSISTDGRYVLFTTKFGASLDDGVYLRDLLNGMTETIPLAAEIATRVKHASMSPNARFILYYSLRDVVYLYDRMLGTEELVSIDPQGARFETANNATVSNDGRIVLFTGYTAANDGLHLYLRDRMTGTTQDVAVIDGGSPFSVSDDGRWIAFSSEQPLVPEDTNGQQDIFILCVPL